jgi:hypothetical protein
MATRATTAIKTWPSRPRVPRPLRREAKPLPDGGYMCYPEFCHRKDQHSHCECGLPRDKGAKRCLVCEEERTALSEGRRLSAVVPTMDYLMGFARALSPSRG